MAIFVQTQRGGGPEIGKVGRSFLIPPVIQLTDVRADRKSADDMHSSTRAYARLLRALSRGSMAPPLLIS